MRSSSISSARVLAAAAAVFALTAVADDRFKDNFRYSYNVPATGAKLDLSSFNGGIELIGVDGNTVEVTGTKSAKDASTLAELKIEGVQEGPLLRVRAVRPGNGERKGCYCGVSFVVRAPKHMELTSVTTSNGSMRVENFESVANLRTSNGAMKLYQLKGRVEARTSNGGVTLDNIDGVVSVVTSNGGVTLENVRGALRAETSNGSIRGRIADTTSGSPVHLSTSNGTVDVRLDATHNNDITVTTSNGSINLRMPDGGNAKILARTSSHESVTTDFPMMIRGTLSKGLLEGSIGSGNGPSIRLETSNGPIRLLRL